MENTKNQMDIKLCPICDRPLTKESASDHHLIPKTFKGKEKVTLHKICHRKLHTVFTEREMLNTYNTIESLLENEDVQTFVKWVAKKDPDYYDGSKDTNQRKSKRRR